MTAHKTRDLSENLKREAAIPDDPLSAEMTEATPAAPQIVFDSASHSQSAYALRDIIGGLSGFSLWSMMGWREIKQRYRRSTLGPLWVTLSMAFTIVGLGLVYGLLFKQNLSTYLPFVCLGMITWEFISKSILEGSTAFVMLEGVIKQIRLPLTTHIASVLWRNIIILAHNAVLYIIVLVIFGIRPGWTVPLFFPGFLLVLLNIAWIALLLATICTRFRDVPLIVQTVVQMVFFVTPVFWLPSLMPERSLLVHGNPFYHMLELLREPLLGRVPDLESWIFLTVTLVVGWAGTLLLFTKFRRRIPYWV